MMLSLFSRLVVSVVVVFSCGVICLAQTPTPAPNLTIEKIDTGDSPIKLEKLTGKGPISGAIVTRKKLEADNRVGYALQNASGKAVRAYALALENGKDKTVRITIYPGIPSATGGYLRGTYVLTDEDKPRWSIDWVLFSDGTSWGPDRQGRSKEITYYLKGRELAVTRTEGLLVGADKAKPFFRSFHGNVLNQWAVEIPIKDKESIEDFFNFGYDSVVNALINYPANGPDADLTFGISQRLRELAIEQPWKP